MAHVTSRNSRARASDLMLQRERLSGLCVRLSGMSVGGIGAPIRADCHDKCAHSDKRCNHGRDAAEPVGFMASERSDYPKDADAPPRSRSAHSQRSHILRTQEPRRRSAILLKYLVS